MASAMALYFISRYIHITTRICAIQTYLNLTGAFIPPIPPKLAIAMWPPGYLTTRSRELQHFLQRIELIPYLKEEEVTKLFLTKHETSFDKERKKWEKQNPKPSEKEQYEKLKEIFPKIHSTQTPEDMDERCRESTKVINESIKYLNAMITAGETFVEKATECNEALYEFRRDFEDLLQIEYMDSIDIERRVDVSPYFEEWQAFKADEIKQMNVFYVPTLHRALNDLKVIEEILCLRDKIQSDHTSAKKKADAWKEKESEDKADNSENDSKESQNEHVEEEEEEKKEEVEEQEEEKKKEPAKENDFKNLIGKLVDGKNKELAKKEREIEKEEDLRNLKDFVEKLVLGQLNVIFSANTRRWEKSCNIFAEKHVKSLEKMIESWKDLEYVILLGKDERYQRYEKMQKKRSEKMCQKPQDNSNPFLGVDEEKKEEQQQQQQVGLQDDFMVAAKSLFSNARNYFMSSTQKQ